MRKNSNNNFKRTGNAGLLPEKSAQRIAKLNSLIDGAIVIAKITDPDPIAHSARLAGDDILHGAFTSQTDTLTVGDIRS